MDCIFYKSERNTCNQDCLLFFLKIFVEYLQVLLLLKLRFLVIHLKMEKSFLDKCADLTHKELKEFCSRFGVKDVVRKSDTIIALDHARENQEFGMDVFQIYFDKCMAEKNAKALNIAAQWEAIRKSQAESALAKEQLRIEEKRLQDMAVELDKCKIVKLQILALPVGEAVDSCSEVLVKSSEPDCKHGATSGISVVQGIVNYVRNHVHDGLIVQEVGSGLLKTTEPEPPVVMLQEVEVCSVSETQLKDSDSFSKQQTACKHDGDGAIFSSPWKRVNFAECTVEFTDQCVFQTISSFDCHVFHDEAVNACGVDFCRVEPSVHFDEEIVVPLIATTVEILQWESVDKLPLNCQEKECEPPVIFPSVQDHAVIVQNDESLNVKGCKSIGFVDMFLLLPGNVLKLVILVAVLCAHFSPREMVACWKFKRKHCVHRNANFRISALQLIIVTRKSVVMICVFEICSLLLNFVKPNCKMKLDVLNTGSSYSD